VFPLVYFSIFTSAYLLQHIYFSILSMLHQRAITKLLGSDGVPTFASSSCGPLLEHVSATCFKRFRGAVWMCSSGDFGRTAYRSGANY
jgi:hypothetical protein